MIIFVKWIVINIQTSSIFSIIFITEPTIKSNIAFIG